MTRALRSVTFVSAATAFALLAGLLLVTGSTAGSQARVAGSSPVVLATGDSMVQPLDAQLERPVERADGRVRSDARPGTGITKPLLLDWVRHAKRQARRHRPRATVMFLGTGDAAPLRPASGPAVKCCRRAWIDEYANRVARMMRSYLRGGRAYVYWLTLPAPRDRDHARRLAAINLALGQAGAGFDANVRVLDTIPVLSPGNRFRKRVRYRGRRVVVRHRDGVHLTAAGARVARDLVVRAMRADGLL